MIRRSTVALLLLLLVLVAAAFYLRDRRAEQEAAATPTMSLTPLFDDALGEPTKISVESAAGERVAFERESSRNWLLTAPEAAAADPAAATAAATQVGDLKILSTVRLAPDVVGLDVPPYTIRLGFPGGESHTLLVGSPTPIRDGYYVQLDDGPYRVVDKYGLDVLLDLLTAPPYLETPTPAPTPSPLDLPTGLSSPGTPQVPDATPGAATEPTTSATP